MPSKILTVILEQKYLNNLYFKVCGNGQKCKTKQSVYIYNAEINVNLE